MVDEPTALMWAVNLGSIEVHPLLARTTSIDEPTAVVFDLDPAGGASILDCGLVALTRRDELATSGLRSFAKTSGYTGIHVFVPLNTRESYPRTKRFARFPARRLIDRHRSR